MHAQGAGQGGVWHPDYNLPIFDGDANIGGQVLLNVVFDDLNLRRLVVIAPGQEIAEGIGHSLSIYQPKNITDGLFNRFRQCRQFYTWQDLTISNIVTAATFN